jgi:peptide/nickel transport system permease protein
MLKVLRYRLLISIPLLIFVSSLTFFLISIIPGDPTLVILGLNRRPEDYALLRDQLGLNKPVLVQYSDWLSNLVHGDLGGSIYNKESVLKILNTRSGVTLSLVAITTLVTGVIGIVLGVISAIKQGFIARFVDVISLIGTATPNFWVALMLISVFVVTLGWLPSIGYVQPSASLKEWIRMLVLPVITLSAPSIGMVAQQTRDSMLGVLDKPFIRTLRASGLSQRSLIFKHALRNAAIPILTVIGLLFVGLFGGTIIAETIFALPGLGGLAVRATTTHDFPVIQGVVLYFTVIVIVVNLAIDLLYVWLDPRIRFS